MGKPTAAAPAPVRPSIRPRTPPLLHAVSQPIKCWCRALHMPHGHTVYDIVQLYRYVWARRTLLVGRAVGQKQLALLKCTPTTIVRHVDLVTQVLWAPHVRMWRGVRAGHLLWLAALPNRAG